MRSPNILLNLKKRHNVGRKKSILLNKAYIMALAGVLASPGVVGNALAADNPTGQTVAGMEATPSDPTLNNYGTISGGLRIEHTNGEVTYSGMFGRSSSSANFNFNNAGKITIHNSSADAVVGMLADAAVSGSHELNNSGDINVSGGNAVAGMSASAGTGIGSQELTNSGTITASGANNINGMFFNANGGKNSLINTNDINISGVVTLAGLNAVGAGNHYLNNSGTVTANGSGAEIYGLKAKGEGNHTLINTNTITVTGGGGDNLYGMSAEGVGTHDVDNHGTVVVQSQANKVHGLHVQSSLDNAQSPHTINNSGTLTVSGVDSVYGIYGEVKSNTLNVNNSGTIEAYGANLVYGMYVAQVQGGNTSHNVTNTGYISANANSGIAYEVYGTTNYNVDTFATSLRDWLPTDAVFGVIDTQKINFNNATLIVRPDTAAQGFAFGQDFKVADMVSLINQGSAAIPSIAANITGSISEAVTEVPFLTATLTNGADPFNASIRLDSNVNSNTISANAATQQLLTVSQTQFSGLSSTLRNQLLDTYTQAISLASTPSAGSYEAPKWQAFFTPYVNDVNNSALNFDGSSFGVVGGVNYRFNEQFTLGGHLSFNTSDLSADIMNMDTNSKSFAFGLHAAYNFTPQWYLRGQVTGSTQDNDSTYTMGSFFPYTASSNFNGQAIYAELATGYTWQVAEGHSLSPEVGLAYLSTQTDAYDVNWSGGGAGELYNMSYNDNSYDAFYATVNLDWRSQWALDEANISLLAGLGLRQKLDNDEIETSVQMLGSSYTTRHTEDATTFLASTGLEYGKGDFSVSLDYDGEYGSDQQVHTGSLNFRLHF